MIQTFEQHRSLLFSIAYRMLGTVAEAEDIVQETFLRIRDTAPESIKHPKAFFSQVTTRLCLDYLKSARQQREVYIGPWLPEPVLTKNQHTLEPDKAVERMDSVSMAFMLLLESLSPAERAVFLLREVFDYPYGEIAKIINKEESACRQLFSRAKKHLTDNRPRYDYDEAQHHVLFDQFLLACQTGNINQLESILASEIVVTVDGGGEVTAATRPLNGRDHAARFLNGIFAHGLKYAHFEKVTVNNQVGLIAYNQNQAVILFTMDANEDGIQQLRAIRNPKKLARFQK